MPRFKLNETVERTSGEKSLAKITREFEIDPLIVVAIVGVETNYGQKTKEFSVMNSLYTQAKNMPKRSKWATKEIAEFLVFCSQNNIDPFSVEGSYAGAFGYGQFIPSSYNAYAIDGNDDGVRKPYDWSDVFASIGNYLIKNGYPQTDPSNQEKVYKSVYAYNHADNYVKAVIELRDELETSIIKNQ